VPHLRHCLDYVPEPPPPPPAAPYQPHSETSKAAAGQIETTTGELRARVLAHLKACGGATDEETQDALGMAQNTERPRRVELVRAGRVIDSGETRKTKSGRSAVVWRAT
jgi:hypothetical protein